MTSATTIFTAQRIITLNGYRPFATAVAVRDGRILCVGTLQECQSWGEAVVDDRFADKILMPGMIEAHGHTAEASNGLRPYAGFYDAPQPDGSKRKGIKSYDELLELLRAEDAALEPGKTLVVNGFDPIFFVGQERLSKKHLDSVSTERPIFIRHASGHLATVNTAMLVQSGITKDSPTPGIALGEDGEPNGELQESPAMSLATSAFELLMHDFTNPNNVVDYARLCRNAGVTTTTELVGALIIMPNLVDPTLSLIEADNFPVRISYYNLAGMSGTPVDYQAAADATKALQDKQTDRFRVGGIKLVADGSLQGWTACCGAPGYYTGEDHGLALYEQEEINRAVLTLHRAGIQTYCHTNGDAAVDQYIEAVELALRDTAWLDHRHTAQHSQTTRASQYRKMATLGMAANIFTNHIYYWGDAHAEQVMGPERVERMWAARSAAELGCSVTYHSDSGVTPTGQLHTAWCAVNRVTSTGQVLGEQERVSVEQALRAVTIEAAYQLHLDHEIGTIEAGKRADFAVLEQDPLEVDPMNLRDVPVWGTVLSGVVHEAERG